MKSLPFLYSLDTTRKKNASCECTVADAETVMPSIQCSWASNEYFIIYISFATSTFSVVNAILNHGFLDAIEITHDPMRRMKKLLFIILGLLSGCYGVTVGMYLIYIKSITISVYILPLFIIWFARICPLEIALHLLRKLFPSLWSDGRSPPALSATFQLLSIISPFWFFNLLKGIECLLRLLMDVNRNGSLRNSTPMMDGHPSIFLSIPCRYGKTPSSSGCMMINAMLDNHKWHPMLDKLYPQLHKPLEYIFSDEGYFIELAYQTRQYIKGIRILSGNFRFLQPYSSQQNLVLILDTLLVGVFSLLFFNLSLKEKHKHSWSILVLIIEIAVRSFALISDMIVKNDYAYAILGVWAILGIVFFILKFLHQFMMSCFHLSLSKRLIQMSFMLILMLLPPCIWFIKWNAGMKEINSWHAMNKFCNRTSFVFPDGRNIIELIVNLRKENYNMFQRDITKTDLLVLVEKNFYEHQFFNNFTQNIIYQLWYPFLFAISFLPLITLGLFILHKDPVQSICNWSFSKLLTLSILLAMVPTVLWTIFFIQQNDFYEVAVERILLSGAVKIKTTHIPKLKGVHNKEFITDLLNRSELLFDEFITSSMGVGDCSDNGRYIPESKDFLFHLKTNFINLKILLIYKKYFILCVAPWLLHIHVWYCST